ncbi:aminoglycoside phosphotransferase [Actinoplanes sp. NBRC 103695]|nr:aminoglycoside phosphotransferase [Actinoplanes sp. NBRC 103695]
MWESLGRIAAALGVEVTGAQLLHLANNAVFALPAAELVVRITRTTTLHARVRKVAMLGAWFDQANAPTIRLSRLTTTQPIADRELLATVWEYVVPYGPPPDAGDLGRVLRTFHEIDVDRLPLPAWDPIGDVRARLDDAEEIDEADRDFLLFWCAELEPRLRAFAERGIVGLVHGDAHEGNLLRGKSGRVLLCDFDATCLGPWQVDLVPAPANEARFGRTGSHGRLAAAYGYDVTDDPAWPLLRQARELKMIAAAVPLLGTDPRIANEFRLRLDSVRTGDTADRWTAFADLVR